MTSIGPGPIYSLPPLIGYDKHDLRKVRGPQYSMRGPQKDIFTSKTPGPGLYAENYTRYGKISSKAYTFRPRNCAKVPKSIGPGPANYDLVAKPYVSKKAPAVYSMARKDKYRFKNLNPGANAYEVKKNMVMNASPAYTFGYKTFLKKKGGSPGAAAYPSCSLKTSMKKAPEYSMVPRTKYAFKQFVPGSNAYDRSKYKPGNTQPAYTFGIRHHPRAPPFIVSQDNIK